MFISSIEIKLTTSISFFQTQSIQATQSMFISSTQIKLTKMISFFLFGSIDSSPHEVYVYFLDRNKTN